MFCFDGASEIHSVPAKAGRRDGGGPGGTGKADKHFTLPQPICCPGPLQIHRNGGGGWGATYLSLALTLSKKTQRYTTVELPPATWYLNIIPLGSWFSGIQFFPLQPPQRNGIVTFTKCRLVERPMAFALVTSLFDAFWPIFKCNFFKEVLSILYSPVAIFTSSLVPAVKLFYS
ncbi:hypothetical protein FKM82_017929 [Ascaphus truei]